MNENETQEQQPEQNNSVTNPTQQEAPQKDEGMPTGIQEQVPEGDDLDNVEFVKPDNFPGKFWDENDGPDVEGLAKAYGELEKKFHNGDYKAPEDYDIKFLEEKGVTNDDSLLNEFTQWAKDNNISQSAFEKITNTYIGMNEQEQQAEEDFIKDEKQKLGNNADAIIDNTIQWGKSLVSKGVLTDDEYTELENWGGTAEGIRLLGKFRQMMGEKEITTTPVEGVQLDKEELQALVADPRYGNDMRYTRDVERKFQERFPG